MNKKTFWNGLRSQYKINQLWICNTVHHDFMLTCYNINGHLVIEQTFDGEQASTFYFQDRSVAKQLGIGEVVRWDKTFSLVEQLAGPTLETFRKYLIERMVFLGKKMAGRLCFPMWFADLIEALDKNEAVDIHIKALKQQLEDNYCEVEAAIGERGVILLNQM